MDRKQFENEKGDYDNHNIYTTEFSKKNNSKWPVTEEFSNFFGVGDGTMNTAGLET